MLQRGATSRGGARGCALQFPPVHVCEASVHPQANTAPQLTRPGTLADRCPADTCRRRCSRRGQAGRRVSGGTPGRREERLQAGAHAEQAAILSGQLTMTSTAECRDCC